MHKVFFKALILAVLSMSISSCGDEKEPEVPTDDGYGEYVTSDMNIELEGADTSETVEPIKWYEGEEPTDLEKLQMLKAFNSGETKFDFYASFTEPFWTFYFFGNEVLFNAADFEVPEVWTLEYPFTDDEDEQALSFMRNGEFWQFKVKKEPGSDGMSDIEYPYSVKLDSFEGGGATEFITGEQ